MNTRSRLSPAARDAVADALLRQHPNAWVVAIVPTGHFTAMPAEVPVTSQRVIEGPFSALDLVVTADRDIVIDAWQRTLTEGGDNIQVHPLNDPERLVALEFIDVRHRYGVLLGFFIGFGDNDTPQAADHADLVPRTSIIRKDQLAVIIDVDDAMSAILGWGREELIGRRTLDIVHPDDQERAIANWMDMVARPGAERRIRLRHRHKDGSYRWLEVTNTNKLDRTDEPHVLSDLVDVTDEITALEALRANEQVLRRLTDALPVGVLTIGVDRRVTYFNESLSAIVGVAEGSTVDDHLATVEPADRDAVRTAVVEVLGYGRDADLEASFHPADDKVHRCVMSLRALTSDLDTVTGAIICLSDITDEVNLREELQRQVRYDPLTACLNHASILAALALRLAEATPQWTVVVFIDLDDFKGVNDRHGHVAGDRLLKNVASRLSRVAGDDDLVGRLGGDEFLVVLTTEPDLDKVTQVVGCLADALAEPVRVGREWTVPRASIGVAYVTPDDDLDADALVAAADSAMYGAKRAGNGVPLVTRAGGR